MATTSMLERLSSALLTVAAVVAATVLVMDRISPPKRDTGRRLEYVKDWQMQTESLGVLLDDSSRAVKVVVFTDFQCPFCRRMDSTLTALVQRHPEKVARLVVHFPIPAHQFAMASARAFECAASQGRALEMHEALYTAQEKFADSAWPDFAKAAGVPDSVAFDACRKSPAPSRINRGIEFGQRLAISGTPTVLVNGWLIDPAFPESVERAVEAALSGRAPKP